MSKTIKLRKGLNINLKGKAAFQDVSVQQCDDYGFVPDDYVGLKPRVLVREGDHVKAGDALFASKEQPEVTVASSVSGTVTAIVRGERRKVLSVNVKADENCEYADYGVIDVEKADGASVIKHLLDAGLFAL